MIVMKNKAPQPMPVFRFRTEQLDGQTMQANADRVGVSLSEFIRRCVAVGTPAVLAGAGARPVRRQKRSAARDDREALTL